MGHSRKKGQGFRLQRRYSRLSVILTSTFATLALPLLFTPIFGGQEWTLEKLMNEMSTSHESNVHFIEKKYNKLLTRPIIQHGTLRYERGKLMEKTITKPVFEKYLIEGNTVTIEQPAQGINKKFVLSQNPVMLAFVESLRSTLDGNLKSLKSYYNIGLQGNSSLWTMRLLPIHPAMERVIENILIKGTKNRILSIEIVQYNGIRSVMTIQR